MQDRWVFGVISIAPLWYFQRGLFYISYGYFYIFVGGLNLIQAQAHLWKIGLKLFKTPSQMPN